MTRRGKCDTCRLRKVKCDQERPCGSCCKKGRPCTYQAASFFEQDCDSANGISHPCTTVLPGLVRCKRSGYGALLTFNATAHPQDLTSTARILSSSQSRRTAQWMGLIRDNSYGWSWCDRYIASASSFIGSDPTVDCAIDFALESYASYRHEWDPAWDRTAQRCGLAAMTALRHDIQARPNLDNTILTTATGLLCVAELFRAIKGVLHYVVHLRACATLLAPRIESESFSELEESLFYMVFLEEVSFAVLRGRRSVFATKTIPSLKIMKGCEGGHHLAEAYATTMNLLTGLSSLGVILRQYQARHNDHSKILKVVAMMRSLYEAGDDVRNLLDNLMTMVPTKCHVAAEVLPQSYTFVSPYDFDLAIHYFAFRKVLYGMIQTFYDNLQADGQEHMFSFMNISDVQSEDEAICQKIALCIDYSNDCLGAPFIPLRFKTVLRNAYGSLARIQARKIGEGRLQEAFEAGQLKHLSYQSCVQTLRMWGHGPEAIPSEKYFDDSYRAMIAGAPWQLEEYFDEDGSFKPD